MPPDRQEEMLSRLEEFMLERGFSNSTIDDYAAELRCSKSTLYAVASSKEQLVIAVVKQFFRVAARHIEAAVAQVEDPRDRIGAYLSGVGTAMRRASTAFYADMTAFPPTAEIYEHNAHVAARRVRELIQEGVERGVFRPVDAAFAGYVVALIIDGIQRGSLLETTGMSSGDAYTELAELLVHGLATIA